MSDCIKTMAKSHHSTTRLSDAAPTCGGFHGANSGADAGSAHRTMRHERLHQEQKNREDLGERLWD